MLQGYNYIGKKIQNYLVTEKLACGTSGCVYKAQHTIFTDRIVAIKFIHIAHWQSSEESSGFLKEAQLPEQLQHKHILHIIDVGVDDNVPYLITDYAPNGSLQDRIFSQASHPLPINEALTILSQIGDALQCAHDHNIIHRDLKPGNILFDVQRNALLSDFGAAIMLTTISIKNADGFGTPAYMAPEQIDSQVSKESDQYALGCIAYELFTGRRPFHAETPLSFLYKHATEPPTPPRHWNPEIPPHIEYAILKALAKKPSDRHLSVAAFIRLLCMPPEEALDITSSYTTSLSNSSMEEILSTKSPASTVLFQSSITNKEERKDYFVTYHNADRFWAEWIAWHLEEAGYTTILPHWDFQVGTDIQAEIRKAKAKAKYIIAIVSPDYFSIRKNIEEWNSTFSRRTGSEDQPMLPVLVRKCESRHMKILSSTMYIDLVELEEELAHQILLAGVRRERIKPKQRPAFPGKPLEVSSKDIPLFPAILHEQDQIQFIRQTFPSIQEAFAKKDWQDVLQKTSSLLHPNDAHTLSADLYRLHGMALFEVGEVGKASEAIETALALESNEEKRFMLLQDYTNILKTLGRWDEVLSHTATILEELPDVSYWQSLQQEALTHTKIIKPLRSLTQSLISVPEGAKVFFSYSRSRKDATLRDEIEKYLTNLKRQHAVISWHDGEIEAGGEWDNEIKAHLDSAHIILLLVSQDFLASKYCYEQEMIRALARHETGEARVIPIILRPSYWESSPFGRLQALPTGGKPITRWQDRDEAFLDVVRGIQKVVDKFTQPRI